MNPVHAAVADVLVADVLDAAFEFGYYPAHAQPTGIALSQPATRDRAADYLAGRIAAHKNYAAALNFSAKVSALRGLRPGPWLKPPTAAPAEKVEELWCDLGGEA